MCDGLRALDVIRTVPVEEVAPAIVAMGGGVRRLELGSGVRRNALSTAAWLRVADLAREQAGDPGLRVLVIRGRGETFCSGSDIAEWSAAGPDDVEAAFDAMEAAFTAVEAVPVPVIAEISGYATGGGMQLALACDLRVMGAQAWIGMPIARLGIQISARFAERLVESTNRTVARDLLYTGRLLDAAAAERLGLVTQIVASDHLAETVAGLAAGIAAQPASALRVAKRRTVTSGSDAPTAAVDWPVFQGAVSAFLRPHRSRSAHGIDCD